MVVTLILVAGPGDFDRLASRMTERRWPAGVEMRLAGRCSSLDWRVLERFERRMSIVGGTRWVYLRLLWAVGIVEVLSLWDVRGGVEAGDPR